MKYRKVVKTLLLISIYLYRATALAQGGASTHSDAIHAFDEPSVGGSSFGFGGFIILLLISVFLLGLWGYYQDK